MVSIQYSFRNIENNTNIVPKCIYRNIKTGIKCTNTITDDNYCNKHLNKKNRIYDILNNSLLNDITLNRYNIFKLLSYIYDNCDDINVKDKQEYFIVCIKYLCYTKENILELINTNECEVINSKLSKNKIIKRLFNIIYNTYKLSKDENVVNKIKKIQRLWLNKLINRVNLNLNTINEKPKNIEDPFTYDLIEDIPTNLKFSYRDDNNNIYTFNGLEFLYFIKNIGQWNPYTRDKLSINIISNLCNFLKYNRIDILSLEDKYKWKTEEQAYTEVSYVMEKAGFYTDVKWFMSLKYDIIINTILCYNKISQNENHSTIFLNKAINKDNYVFDFCNQIIELFENANDHYVLCCNFFRALALNNIYFYNNIPDWVYDLSSPDYNIQYNNMFGNNYYNTTFTTELNARFVTMYYGII